MSESVYCPRCGARLAERLPGGPVLIDHGGRETLHLTGALRTSCNSYDRAKRGPCGQRVLIAAIPEEDP